MPIWIAVTWRYYRLIQTFNFKNKIMNSQPDLFQFLAIIFCDEEMTVLILDQLLQIVCLFK